MPGFSVVIPIRGDIGDDIQRQNHILPQIVRLELDLTAFDYIRDGPLYNSPHFQLYYMFNILKHEI